MGEILLFFRVKAKQCKNNMCKVKRYIGEVFMGVLLGICGFCCGVLPIIVCGCFHEVLSEDDRDETNAEKA